MRALVQRVSEAKVIVDQETVGKIQHGLLVLVGVGKEDTLDDVLWLAKKVMGLRIFTDSEGKMNLSVDQVGGRILAVSQFTLYGDCRRGRRPSFEKAGRPEHAEPLFEEFVKTIRENGLECETGRFQTHMNVHLCNDGPVTLWIDSHDRKRKS